MEAFTRKIVKNGRGSYYINIPIDIMRELKFRERQKLEYRGQNTVFSYIQGYLYYKQLFSDHDYFFYQDHYLID